MLVSVPRMGRGVVKYPAAAGPRNQPPAPTPKHSEFKCAFAALPPDASSMGREDTEDLSTSLWEPVIGGAAWAEESCRLFGGRGRGKFHSVTERSWAGLHGGHLSLVPGLSAHKHSSTGTCLQYCACGRARTRTHTHAQNL